MQIPARSLLSGCVAQLGSSGWLHNTIMKKDITLNDYENTKRRGAVGLGAAVAYFTKLGYIVSIPLNDSQDYDLIIDDGSKLEKSKSKP